MAVIPLTLYEGRVYVRARIVIGVTSLAPDLTFLVDTAAQQTFICQQDEEQLQLHHGQMRFNHNVTPVGTMLGRAPVKSLLDHGGKIAIQFRDLGESIISKQVNYLYFADHQKRVVPSFLRSRVLRWCCPNLLPVWDVVGQGLKHSILGQDVLNQLAFVSIPNQSYAFLSDNPQQLRIAVDTSYGNGLTKFYEAASKKQKDVEWIN